MHRTIVITGANRGIGLELARQASASGASVIATARKPEKAAELNALDVRVEQLDVADPSSVARLAATLGDLAVEVLINNAGVGVGHTALEALDPESLLPMFSTNAVGPLRVTRALLPHLRRGREKRVVQMTSRMGSIADNTSGDAYAYRASKAALNMINKSLALDLAGEGFTCIVTHPGWVTTDMGGQGAPLSVQDSAAGLLKVVDTITVADNGRFLMWDGEELPW